jgi:rod shape-determining protein MreD
VSIATHVVAGAGRVRLVRGAALLVLAVVSVAAAARTPLLLPDLVLPLVVAGGLVVGGARGALLGLGAGWLVDLVPPGATVLGTGALAYAACGLLAGAGRRAGLASWRWGAVVGTLASAVLVGGGLLVALLEGSAVSLTDLGVRLVLTALLCAVAVPTLVRAEQHLRARS